MDELTSPASAERAPSGEDLARRLADGDTAALDALYDRYAPGLYHYALSMLGREEDVEDVLQELFLKVVRARKSLAKARLLRPYLFAMLRHEIGRKFRKRSAEKIVIESVSLFERIPAGGISTGAVAAIESALLKLPAEQREVIVLKIYEGLTFREIGEVMRISANTAASRYRYALDKLRAILPPETCKEL